MTVFRLKNGGRWFVVLLTWYLLCQLVHSVRASGIHTFHVMNLLISFSMNKSIVLSIKCHLIITWGLCHCYFLYMRQFLIFPMKEQSNNQILMSHGPLLNVKWLLSASQVSQPYSMFLHITPITVHALVSIWYIIELLDMVFRSVVFVHKLPPQWRWIKKNFTG